MPSNRRIHLLKLAAASFAFLIAGAQAAGGQAPSPTEAKPATAEPALADLSPPAFPDALSSEGAFLHLQVAVGALNEASATNDKLDQAAIASVGGLVNILQDLFRPDKASSSSPEYIGSLNFTANAIAAVAAEEDPASANRELALLKRDLSIKVATARATLGATGRLPGQIPVRVTTRKGAAAVTGYLIRAKAALFARRAPIYTFSNPTNPRTSRNLTPGLYIFHAYDGSGREVRVINFELEVGLDGGDSAELILLLG